MFSNESQLPANMPKYDVVEITHEKLIQEYDFITVERFIQQLRAEDVFSDSEADQILKCARDRFVPLYAETRA